MDSQTKNNDLTLQPQNQTDVNKDTRDNFDTNKKKLKGEKIEIDEYDNIKNIEGDEKYLISKVAEYDESNIKYLTLFLANLIYYIQKYVIIFVRNFIYQINKVYNTEYSYYDLFLNIIFVIILFIIGIILYWDYIYRTATKTSRCKNIKTIIDQNAEVENPFVYVIMIIHKYNIDALQDKYVMKIEYNFLKRTTRIIYGDEQYRQEYSAYTSTPNKPFYYYNIEDMTYKVLENIDSEVITGPNYKYIPMTNKGNTIKTDTAQTLAKFVKDYGKSKDTFLYPIYDILNAVQQYEINM